MDDIENSNTPGDNSAHPIENLAAGYDEEYGVGTWWRTSAFPTTTSLYPNWTASFFANDGVHYILATSGSGNPMPFILLDSSVVYRLEWAIYRVNTTQYTMQCRVYNAAGTLLYDENDFFRPSGSALAGLTHTFVDAASTGAFACGSNQSNFFTSPAPPHSYQAAPAISDEDWCGPYNAATEATWDA
jgi:hypothetical protein